MWLCRVCLTLWWLIDLIKFNKHLLSAYFLGSVPGSIQSVRTKVYSVFIFIFLTFPLGRLSSSPESKPSPQAWALWLYTSSFGMFYECPTQTCTHFLVDLFTLPFQAPVYYIILQLSKTSYLPDCLGLRATPSTANTNGSWSLHYSPLITELWAPLKWKPWVLSYSPILELFLCHSKLSLNSGFLRCYSQGETKFVHSRKKEFQTRLKSMWPATHSQLLGGKA